MGAFSLVFIPLNNDGSYNHYLGNQDASRMTDLQVRLKYSKSERDDWTKVEDKALRKRIQDRLAKRKSRTLHSIGVSFARN